MEILTRKEFKQGVHASETACGGSVHVQYICFADIQLDSRVRSWLRMNAGGVPNTCKSNGVYALMIEVLA